MSVQLLTQRREGAKPAPDPGNKVPEEHHELDDLFQAGGPGGEWKFPERGLFGRGCKFGVEAVHKCMRSFAWEGDEIPQMTCLPHWLRQAAFWKMPGWVLAVKGSQVGGENSGDSWCSFYALFLISWISSGGITMLSVLPFCAFTSPEKYTEPKAHRKLVSPPQ